MTVHELIARFNRQHLLIQFSLFVSALIVVMIAASLLVQLVAWAV